MPHPLTFRTPPIEFIASEALYASVIFILCFLLYHRLREVYRLTDYKGFQLFSSTFLFLGLAYFLRFVVTLLLASGFLLEEISFEGLRGIAFFSVAFLAYTGSAAILYAAYSLLWRWVEKFPGDIVIHVASLLIAIVSLFVRQPGIFIVSQLILLILLLAAIFINYRHYESEKVRRVYPLYTLLFAFWLLNISLLFGFIREFRPLIYTLSIAIIAIIAYRVLRKL